MAADREELDPVVEAARYGAVPTLMDSLLHDVRNPLNALSIHLELLSEKLKAEAGELSPAQEKSLRAMRSQIQRVDGLLKQFADFIVCRGSGPGQADLSAAVERALQVLTHESRRRRLKLEPQLESGVQVRLPELGELGFLVVQPLLGALERAQGRVEVAVRREPAGAVLEVVDGSDSEVAAEAVVALERRCQQLGVELQRGPGRCRLIFPPG